ncbi:MAG: uridylate kinase [Methylotenera sp.]|nr:uridylate kinase [Methylotenera sp.]
MWIVKLGGSLLGSPELPRWLDTLVKISDGKVLIVPGGGLFADAVREAQQRTKVSDVVAHELALLAMDQFGLLLAGINTRLVTANSELEIAERGWQHRCIVWLPSRMVLADDGVPRNWQVTSDSISAWLANKIGAEHLVLVKSKSLESYSKSTDGSQKGLQGDGLIDEAFADFFIGNHPTWIVNKLDYGLFEQGLNLPLLKKNSLGVNKLMKG